MVHIILIINGFLFKNISFMEAEIQEDSKYFLSKFDKILAIIIK